MRASSVNANWRKPPLDSFSPGPSALRKHPKKPKESTTRKVNGSADTCSGIKRHLPEDLMPKKKKPRPDGGRYSDKADQLGRTQALERRIKKKYEKLRRRYRRCMARKWIGFRTGTKRVCLLRRAVYRWEKLSVTCRPVIVTDSIDCPTGRRATK